jgi:predicted nucleic acid-binding protein
MMRMIVVDTNVLSEVMKPAHIRSSHVLAWFNKHPVEALYTTTITLGEILAGIAILPDGKRKAQKQGAAELIFATVFSQRILPFDSAAARVYAEIITAQRKKGRTADSFDVLIAAIAKVQGMAVATRNVPDFEICGVEIVNPWPD